MHEEDVEIGAALLVFGPMHRRPQLGLAARVLPGDELRCAASVVFAFLRIPVRPFSRTNITIASLVSRQPV
jgi:hypothetical protein